MNTQQKKTQGEKPRCVSERSLCGSFHAWSWPRFLPSHRLVVVARVGGLQAFPADNSQIWYRCTRKGGICRMTEGEASHVDRRQCGVRFGPFIA